MLGLILEKAIAGLLIGALFGLGYYIFIYGLEFLKTVWQIRRM